MKWAYRAASAFALLCLRLVPIVSADSITLTNGNTVQGVITSEDTTEVGLHVKSGTIYYSRAQIASIKKGSEHPASADNLPAWQDVISAAMSTSWGSSFHQIPATVIDNGVMKNVPYYSYRANDYEVNIYGDPDHPIGVEIGIYHELLKSTDAKKNCQRFMTSILGDKAQRDAVTTLGFDKGSKEVGAWTIEITPETDPDAYEGWWISAYSVGGLDSARATEDEMKAITVKRAEIAAEKAAAEKEKRDAAAIALAAANHRTPSSDPDWTPADLTYARPSASTGSYGGSVYVHGYTRKDGTYVHSYTRSAPGFGSSHGRR